MYKVKIWTHLKNIKHYRWVVAVLCIFAAIVGFIVSGAETIVLRAEEPLALRADLTLPPTGANIIATLHIGDNADVIQCMDIKTDVVILLRTSTGETGYVGAGKYTLLRSNVSIYTFFCRYSDITFSCKGMFEHRSRWVDDGS